MQKPDSWTSFRCWMMRHSFERLFFIMKGAIVNECDSSQTPETEEGLCRKNAQKTNNTVKEVSQSATV